VTSFSVYGSAMSSIMSLLFLCASVPPEHFSCVALGRALAVLSFGLG
jgi:hypothetical protein